MSRKSNSNVESIELTKEYTPAEAGRYLGLSYKQVSRLIDDGYLEGARRSPMPGSHRYTTGAAILRYLEKRK